MTIRLNDLGAEDLADILRGHQIFQEAKYIDLVVYREKMYHFLHLLVHLPGSSLAPS